MNADTSKKSGWIERHFEVRVWKRLFWAGLMLLFLVFIFYMEEMVRGWWGWKQYQRELQRQGIPQVEPPEFPRPPAPEKNLACGPTLKPVYDYLRTQQPPPPTNAWDILRPLIYADTAITARQLKPYREWAAGKLPDPVAMVGAPFSLASKGKTNAGPILGPLDPDQAVEMLLKAAHIPELDALQQEARERPLGQFEYPPSPDNLWQLTLPHLSALGRLGERYQIRAIARLYLGQHEAARQDILMGLRLSELLREEPLLVALYGRFYLRELQIGAIYFGLAKGAWNEAQIAEFQARLEEADILGEARRTLQRERGLAKEMVQSFARTFPFKTRFSTISDAVGRPFTPVWLGLDGKEIERWFSPLYPKGWFYHEMKAVDQFYVHYLLNCLPTNQTRVDWEDWVTQIHELQASIGRWPKAFPTWEEVFSHRMWLGWALMGESRAPTLMHVMAAHTAHSLAITACALERYRLAHHKYPSTLTELVPAYLKQVPFDYWSGQPLNYRLKDGGGFVMTCTGIPKNNRVIKQLQKLEPTMEIPEGGWTWEYPARP